MTTTTLFFTFIPLLAFILLAVNLIFAPHNPYQEKDNVFECGFHSFLGQNRTQFSISFFIFALLFLLFDLEILLVYPYTVSAYTNSIYGLIIMLIFFSVLTIGFVFELGKKALKIDSRQVFSLLKVQTQTTTTTSVSGFFSRDYLAIFKGLIKLEFLKLALKKVFSPWPVFIMVMAFIVTVMIRLQLKKYDCDFVLFQSDLLFCISSISTIFTGTLIRKYFQLFNSIFESFDWSAVYYFFTCSKAERLKLLQDFIKSLEEFNNEKIKVNNPEDSSNDNVSSNKKKPFNIYDFIFKKNPDTGQAPSRPSGSGNNNASGSGTRSSGNNNTAVARPSGSGNNNTAVAIASDPRNNNTAVAGASGSNNLTTGRLSQLEQAQQNRAADLIRRANSNTAIMGARGNNPTTLSAEEIREWENLQLGDPGRVSTVHEQDNTVERIWTRTVFSNHEGKVTPFSSTSTTSPYTGPLNDHFARYAGTTGYCSPMWLRAIEHINLDHNHVVVNFTNRHAVDQEYSNILDIIIKIKQTVGRPNITNNVGTFVGDRTIHGILRRYPYLFDEFNTYEPSLLHILINLCTCFGEIHCQAFELAHRFSHLEQYMSLNYNPNITLGMYKNANNNAYLGIKSLVEDFGDPELRNYFSDDNNSLLYTYISLKNAQKDLLYSARKYEKLLREIQSLIRENTYLSDADIAYRMDNWHVERHQPTISSRVEVKFSRIRN